jgi:hypothetical protein
MLSLKCGKAPTDLGPLGKSILNLSTIRWSKGPNKLVPFTLSQDSYSIYTGYITSVDGFLLHSQRFNKFLTSRIKVLLVGGEKSEAWSSSDVKHEKFSQVPTGCSGQSCRRRRK